MYSKPAGCAACPLVSKGLGFVRDKIAPKAKFVFQGEAPGKNEVEAGEPFVGKAGFVLKFWLVHAVPYMKLAMERGEVSLVNTLRCLPPEVQGRPYPKGEEKLQAESCCRQYDTPLDGITTVVLFGESPQRAEFAKELEAEDIIDRKLGHDVKGVAGRMGRVYSRDGRRFVFAPHPAWILRQPSLVEHGQACLRIASGQEKPVEVDYQQWDAAIGVLACA